MNDCVSRDLLEAVLRTSFRDQGTVLDDLKVAFEDVRFGGGGGVRGGGELELLSKSDRVFATKQESRGQRLALNRREPINLSYYPKSNMAIIQSNIEKVISSAGAPANTSGRKVWIMDGGNMMTAISDFKKMTGMHFDPNKARTSPQGFKFETLTERVNGADVTITLRGGSSSVIDTNHGPHAGPPTIEIQNAQVLGEVGAWAAYVKPGDGDKVIVEIKYTTRASSAWIYANPFTQKVDVGANWYDRR